MEDSKYKGFKDLNCWKEGRTLRNAVSALAKTFPSDEKFLLTSQIKRASRSVTANIAEGYGRFTYADTRHFFVHARGSVTETMEHLTVAFDEGYISDELCIAHEEKCELVFKLINGYISYLDKSRSK